MRKNDRYAIDLNWPLSDQGMHFELGHVLNSAIVEALEPAQVGSLAPQHAGVWECDLSDSSLIWSGGVYDMFGLRRGLPITRDGILSHYTEDSRAKLERLRTHAIRHLLGFTVDIEVRAAAVGLTRKVRVIGAPVCVGENAVRLHGLKLAI